MEIINSYYKFQVIKPKSGDLRARLLRKEKYGNCMLLNNLFENHEKLGFKQCSSNSIDNYICFIINDSKHKSCSLPILFETSSFSYPYGIVRSEILNEVALFKVTDELCFEVFIIDKHSSDTMNCFQLLIDGYLEDEIESVKTKIF